jgi:tRNA-specific 2-thiouridylase
MSGGVDSSVAASLLLKQGHEVIGVFMRHGQDESTPCAAATPPAADAAFGKQGCCSAADAADARRVADRLGIPFYAINFQTEFGRIVDYFVEQYLAGRTPNPCIVCNTWIKFGKLVEYADAVGAEFVATGHYARLVQQADGQIALCRGRDESKDQSYVLFGIDRRLLPRLLFPVGEYRKEEIRTMAGELGLAVAAKRDSQEICFVPDQDHARFIRQRCGDADRSGDIVTTDGVIVGRHQGVEQFTIGQRKGLRVAFGEPRYIVRIEPDTRRVVIGTRDDLARTELTANNANWLADPETAGLSECKVEESANASSAQGAHRPSPFQSSSADSSLPSFRCQVKIRYRSRPAAATVDILPNGRFRVRFDEPCHAVAPGQAAVCYDGDRLLGGGWIES